MARTASCPSCGAKVRFQSATSILAVCEYCQSTLLQVGEHLQELGKMAALVEDRTPLQIGTQGRYRKLGFTIIGRIQLRYEQGVWNEWHLLFDDQRTGWLSEAAGEYAVFFLQKAPDRLPYFHELQPGDQHVIAGEAYVVTNIEAAECVAGEGELPFKVGAGYPAPVADLRSGLKLLTLDYSEGQGQAPLLFMGEAVPYKNLHFTQLRDLAVLDQIAAPTTKARALNCRQCGASLTVNHEGVLAIGCSSCGAVTDTETRQLLSPTTDFQRIFPLLPLGSQGLLQDQPVEIIGFMQRRSMSEGITYRWREYLLARTDRPGYLWLVESDGHWNLGEVVSVPPTQAKARYKDFKAEGVDFHHFANYKAIVDYVEGEFTWRVTLGETAVVNDYIAPPVMFTIEQTDKELTWTRSEYLQPEAVQTAFQKALKERKLPQPRGVYANQPSPRAAIHQKVCRMFWWFFLAALAIQLAIVFTQKHRTFLSQQVMLETSQAPVRSQGFVVDHDTASLLVQNQARVDNDWVALELTLINQQTGAAYPASREISYYHGYDEGQWSEGSQTDEIVFRDIPAGQYTLVLEPEFAAGRTQGTENMISITQGTAGWGSFFVLILLLMCFPLWTRWRMSRFEYERMQESDHPPEADD